MKGKSLLGLLLSLLIIAGSVYIAFTGIGEDKKAGASDIQLGLDLAGGVSITYKTVIDDPTDEQMSDTIYKLRKRIDSMGYTEGDVYKEGSNRINIDIPGAQDANQVLQELGGTGVLEFRDQDGNVIIDGNDVVNATQSKDTSTLYTSYQVNLELNSEGADKFSAGTLANIGKPINIYYDNEYIIGPTVRTQITNGYAVISGLESLDEAANLASTIRIGALPLELEELRSNVVGAKLGQEAISTSLFAGFVGIIIIFAFMIFFYRLPGFVSALALAFYAALTIILISVTNLTLTLPGIAGIILSVGMAVDANVIIFSRIREELAMDKTLRASVRAGFVKATSAILDGNITTLIAAVVLFVMGTGPIKGFATTLFLGIVVSMFTAMVVSRVILSSLANLGLNNKKLYGVAHEKHKIRVVEKRKIWFVISAVAIAAGLIMLPINQGTKGSILNFDIDFAGGTSTLVTVNEGQDYDSQEALEADLKTLVVDATGDTTPQFQNVKGKEEFIITTSNLDNEGKEALTLALTTKFGIDEESIQMESISGTISSEMQRSALISILVASAFILLYITFRFKDIRFGVSAVIALLHDVLIVLAVYTIGNIPINNSFIAAMLTIIGYSINDTIVLFDRVRENQKHMKRGDFIGVVDLSVSQTLSRSINTSLTTFIMILMLYILGVASIQEFALPLMVGIISGTYSSIFIASPLWYLFKKKEELKIQKAHSN